MERDILFRDFKGFFWPEPEQLASYFLTRAGTDSWSASGNDSWGLGIRGLMGTEHLPVYAQAVHANRGGRGVGSQVEAHLSMTGDPQYGVVLQYRKFGNGIKGTYRYSIGDPSRLHEWMRTLHGDLMPVGLFIPFSEAWPAVKEFMDTDGEAPTSGTWIASIDLPPGTFPDPASKATRAIRAIND